MIKLEQIAGTEAKDSAKDLEIMMVHERAAVSALEIYIDKCNLGPPNNVRPPPKCYNMYCFEIGFWDVIECC